MYGVYYWAKLRGKIDQAWLVRELYQAFFDAKKGKIDTDDENNFEMDLAININLLADEILDGKYEPLPGVCFIINDPTKREVFAAPFRDRVVHHFLYNMCHHWWEKRLIDASSSCRKGRGIIFAQKKLQKHMRQGTKGGRVEAMVCKFDLSGYFMSLPRVALFARVRWGLKRQFPHGGPKYRLLRYLWGAVIFDDPTDGVIKRSPESAWIGLADSKSLLKQIPGLGIVIGNLSSQDLSNMYLDMLDQFVTKQLGYKFYGRYVDDFYVIVPITQYEQFKRDVKLIDGFLESIGLTLHKKKRYFQQVGKGVGYLGVIVFPNNIVPAKRYRRNTRQASYEVAVGKRKVDSLQSYLGFGSHMNAEKFYKQVFERLGWDYPSKESKNQPAKNPSWLANL